MEVLEQEILMIDQHFNGTRDPLPSGITPSLTRLKIIHVNWSARITAAANFIY